MKRSRIFLTIGVWVAVLPYLGFPHSWKNILFTLTGLVIAYMGYAMYQEYKKLTSAERSFDNFRESSPVTSTEA